MSGNDDGSWLIKDKQERMGAALWDDDIVDYSESMHFTFTLYDDNRNRKLASIDLGVELTYAGDADGSPGCCANIRDVYIDDFDYTVSKTCLVCDRRSTATAYDTSSLLPSLTFVCPRHNCSVCGGSFLLRPGCCSQMLAGYVCLRLHFGLSKDLARLICK